MKQRIITGVILSAIVVAMFLLRELNLVIFDTFVALAIVFSVAEVSRVFIRSGRHNFMELAIVYSICVYLLLIWGVYSFFTFGAFVLSQLALLMIFFVISFFLTLIRKKQVQQTEHFKVSGLNFYEYSMQKSLRTLFVMLYPTILLMFLYLINHIQELHLSSLGTTAYAGVDLGLLVLLMTFLTTVAADTFAYFVGSTIGGPKLAPLISPKKTISGAVGGLIGSIVVAVIIYIVFNNTATFNAAFFQAEISIWHFIIYGFFASIISQAGDLFASMVKRHARAKDYSSIFPGHGGFMDRLDGISFNAIFTFIYVMLFFM